MLIGKRIRELRKKHQLTLSELAQKSGIQIATLSRIENLKMTGTLESHLNIAKVFGIDVTELYKNLSHTSSSPLGNAIQDTDNESFTYNDKAYYEILANRVTNKKMLPIILRIDEHGITTPEENAVGAEKFMFILEGEITAFIGEKTHRLKRHQTLYFDASLRHHFKNTGKGTAKAILVNTPVAL
ncbi:MAG: XRE family transcriptional regulator [Candidatus Omnitrophica bacterium]|nr:XRE family transcriptional regulator [Candidatus Omnitrophota bacterium]